MKNIHVIPTKKLSNLLLCIKSYVEHKDTPEENSDNKGDFRLGCGKYASKVFYKPHHMYINSDEEIKEGDWVLNTNTNSIAKYTGHGSMDWWVKIILTTDQDLIADGVQAIDDEFLEWFVKNPSCDEVEVLRCPIEGLYTIIPKEEPKQKCECTDECLGYLTKECKRIEEPKQEITLEEAAERLIKLNRQDAFYEGAKYQAERSYSEEDMKSAFKIGFSIGYGSDVHAIDEKNRTCNEWFEQFKKK